MGSSKFPKLGFLWLYLQTSDWGLNQSCSPHQELFNSMLHATYTQGNRIDSQLLMVENQIANLTPGPSFGNNLCFKLQIGHASPFWNIYVSIVFQWYKKIFNPLHFGPCNCSLNIRKSTGTPTPKVEAPLGVRVHSLTLSFIPGLSSFGPQPCKPCFGREPKARVATPCSVWK